MNMDIYDDVFSGSTQQLHDFPEKRLLTAVLKRALYDLSGKDRLHSSMAAKWFFDASRNVCEFSFPWICEQLELNIEELLDDIRNIMRLGREAVE
jgi:hypothetical protein